MPKTGEHCVYYGCDADGRAEYAGYCGDCWAEFYEDQRQALLRGYEPDRVPLLVTERIIERIHPRTRLARVVSWLWHVGMTAAVAWLVWRIHR